MPTFVASQIGKGTVLQTPTADGTVGQFLKTDGAGNLSFDTVAASPAGSDTQIQFNDGGSFGGSANLTWDDATLQVTGTSTTAPTLIAKLPASATDNAFEVQNSTGTTLSNFDKSGDLRMNRASARVWIGGIGGGFVGVREPVNGGSYGIGYNGSFDCLYVATYQNRNLVFGTAAHGSAALSKNLVTMVTGTGSPYGSTYEVASYWGLGATSTTRTTFPIYGTNGSGTDDAGTDLVLGPGAGTGTGLPGSFIVKAAPGDAGTGTSLNDRSSILIEATANATAGTMAFFGSTPVIQQAGTGETTGFTAGSGTAVNDDSTLSGNVGTAAYTISDIVKALKNYGLLASS